MITPDLQAAVSQFLAYFLQPLRLQSGGGPLSPSELAQHVQHLGPELEITIGEYRPYLGLVPLCGGVTVPATHALQVSRTPVTVEAGGADGIIVSHDEPDNGLPPHRYVLRWMTERGDIRVDGEQTLRRVLADLRPPSTWSGGAPDDSAPDEPGDPDASAADAGPSYGDRLAEAIAALPDRRTYPRRLDDVASVPGGTDLSLEEYRQILARFFTYDDNGDYYAKWPIDEEGEFPEDATDQYRFINVNTAQLSGDDIFVVGNVPSDFGLPGHETRRAGEFREFIARIDASGGDPDALGFDVVNSAAKTLHAGNAPARDVFDFCFFTVTS